MYTLGGLLPFLAPTGTGPVLCLSSSEAEDAVQEEEEAHLRLVVPGMLQLSRYLAGSKEHEGRVWHRMKPGPRQKAAPHWPYLRMLSRQLICW